MTRLPDYVVINNSKETKKDVLTTPARTLNFPLPPEDKKLIDILETKYDQEENCAGLAAPQIGFGIRAIVFATPDDPELKKWREDLTQTMPKTIWINPTYEPVGKETHTDYEGCFSVDDLAGPVARYKKVRYTAYTLDGKFVEGEAEGFLARIIQHEVDHLNGTCFIDRVPEDELFSIEAYREMRRKKMAAEGE